MSKARLKPMTASPAYVKFVNSRDQALERILHVHLSAIDQVLGKLKRKVIANPTQHATAQEFNLAISQIETIWTRNRAEAYFLAHVGEAEAIGRALEKPTKFLVHTKKRHEKLHDGVSKNDRIFLAMTKLYNKVTQAIQLSQALDATPEEACKRVLRAFPPTRPLLKTKALARAKKLKEARLTRTASDDAPEADEPVVSLVSGFADADLWDDILTDYNSTTLPSDIYKRGPTDKTLFYDVTTEKEEERYAWEVEQEVTEDFVRSVRAGTQDAAAENGIDDLIWNAILDGATDQCCEVRDGHTSVEIENMLDAGKLDEDECDAIVAPGHFGCRCNSVPSTTDMPDKPMVDFAGFDEWLNAKGKAA